MGVKERLIDYLKFKGIGQVKFAESIGVSSGYVNNIRKSIQPDKLLSISKLYPDLNTGWLLTGEGQMLKDVEEVSLSPSSKLGAELDEYTAYLIPQYAIGGSLTGFSNDGVALQNCEKVISPIKGV